MSKSLGQKISSVTPSTTSLSPEAEKALERVMLCIKKLHDPRYPGSKANLRERNRKSFEKTGTYVFML